MQQPFSQRLTYQQQNGRFPYQGQCSGQFPFGAVTAHGGGPVLVGHQVKSPQELMNSLQAEKGSWVDLLLKPLKH